eukprot:11067743-Alexandrium_andersonii.AAC.1
MFAVCQSPEHHEANQLPRADALRVLRSVHRDKAAPVFARTAARKRTQSGVSELHTILKTTD